MMNENGKILDLYRLILEAILMAIQLSVWTKDLFISLLMPTMPIKWTYTGCRVLKMAVSDKQRH